MEKQSTSQTASADEAVLLRDWDIERFFSSDRASKKSSSHSQKSNVIAVQLKKGNPQKPKLNDFSIERNIGSKIETDQITGKQQVQSVINNTRQKSSNFLSNFLDNAKNPKRQDTDSKTPSNFIRGFRREHSDFFPSTKRHSVVLGERQSAISHIVPQRSSAIYTKHNKSSNGEPILTDFVSRAYLENSPSSSIPTKTTTSPATSITTSSSSIASANNKCNSNDCHVNNTRNLFSMGPRREKTESVISLRNSANRNLLFDQLQVK